MFEQNQQPEKTNHKPEQMTSVRLKEVSGKTFLVLSTLTLLAVLAVSGYLMYWKINLAKEYEELKKDKETKLAEYNSPQNTQVLKKATEIIPKAKTLDTVLNNRLRWSKLFQIINQESLRKVNYTNISFTDYHTISLQAETPDYETFAKALKAWESAEAAEKVTLGTFAKVEGLEGETESTPDKITFTIIINLKTTPSDTATEGNALTDATAQTTDAAATTIPDSSQTPAPAPSN